MSAVPMAAERQRVLDLQADRAVQGLDLMHRLELRALVARHSDLDHDRMELAAAAVDLALARQARSLPLPDHLRDRLRQSTVFPHPRNQQD